MALTVETRNALLGALRPKLATEEVALPKLGVSVFVRQLTVGELGAFSKEHQEAKEDRFQARLFAAAACDEGGTLLYGPEHVDDLNGLPAQSLDPAVEAIMRLNGMDKDTKEAIAKNSGSGPESVSVAASPSA